MLEGEHSYQRGQENLVPSNNASSAPESPIIPKAQEKPWYIQRFTKLLIGFGLGGGAVAILLPWMLWLHCGMSSGSSDQLRLHLLYVTGGIIAVLTLLQTNWKNQGDRLKIDADIKKNEQDAEKNERDHTRQVHAERRSRYTAAVGQLADEKAAIRLGGIYTLVSLVDEWLTDNTISEEEQQKEGQVIINNLCSYIRSPFPLAEKREVLEKDQVPDDYDGSFTADRAQLRGEQDIRRAIFEEISKRSSTVSVDGNEEVTVTPGAWSGFKFNFSRTPIFYPLNNLTIEQGSFPSARFYGKADFMGATFTGNADFVGAKFTENADFSLAKFAGNANFRDAKFAGNTNFWGAKFAGNTNFWGAKFTKNANFSLAKFTGIANFPFVEFTGITDFLFAKFTRNADFNGAYFKKSAPTFAGAFGSARFSAQVNPRGYVFSVRQGSKPIDCGTATLDGNSFEIPLGTVLFDPDSWDEEEQYYTRFSKPAK